MSLLESLASHAAEKLGEVVTEEKADDLLRSAERRATEVLGEGDELILVRTGLEVLGEHKASLVGLTRGTAASALAALAAGEGEAAERLVSQVQGLTYEERRAAMQAGTDATLAAADAAKARKEAWLAFAKDVGRLGVTKLLPFLLAAL